MPDYKNFELQIHQLGENLYLAKVTNSPTLLEDESVSVRFSLPYPQSQIERFVQVLSGERRVQPAGAQRLAREFGEAFFKAIFAGEVAEAYAKARDVARTERAHLRFRLNLSRAGDIADLPWELLRDPEVDFLSLDGELVLVRHIQRLVSLDRLSSSPPLRILVMISAPENQTQIDEAAERANLEAAVGELREKGLAEIAYLEDASLRSLQNILRENNFDVFHYIGHSDFNPETGVGMLALEDPYEHKIAVPITGEALARELHDEEGIRLVVLNSCEGAQQDTRDPFSGIASSLVQRGLPAVVAQQFEISDQAAIEFSKEFYKALARGYKIEMAVSEGRRAVANTLNNTEWVSPVLFMHDHDSRSIFEFSGTPNMTLGELVRDRLYQIIAGVSGMVTLALIGVILGFGGDDEQVPFIPPPTVTPLPLVDLVITNISLEPRNPQPGQEVAVVIDIENRGSDPAAPFSYEWQPSIFSAQKLTRRVEGLAPGGVLRDSLTFRFGWWGTFISEGRVDTGNEIIEISEQNNKLNPIRTNTRLPFDIHFGDPLPDGTPVEQTMILPPDAFAAWGFEVRAEADDPACENAVVWLKFVRISWVALGIGLPDNPDMCTDADLVVTFLERTDNNLSGVSALNITTVPDGGSYILETYDQAGNLLETVESPNNIVDGIILMTTPDLTTFAKVFSVRISGENNPTLITDLTLFAP